MGNNSNKSRRESSSSTHSFSAAVVDDSEKKGKMDPISEDVSPDKSNITTDESSILPASKENQQEPDTVPQKSDTGHSTVSSISGSEVPKKSETTESESGFTSDDEFSTDSELSSDDSLFEFEIDRSHGTLKMKPKPDMKGKQKHRRHRKKHKKHSHHHMEDGDEEVQEEEVDFFEKKEKRHDLHKIKATLKTGDLCVMYRAKDPEPQYAIIVDYSECAPHFPLLILKGRSKFMSLAEFSRKQCLEVKLISASSRIFYGDFNKVYIHRLKTGQTPSCMDINKVKDAISKYEIYALEREAIEREISSLAPTGFMVASGEDSIRPNARILKVPSCLVVAHAYSRLGYLKGNPCQARPDNLLEMIDLEEKRIRIKVPKPRMGPMQKGEPPLLSRLIDDVMDTQSVDVVNLQSVIDNLQTGDIILMTGVTVSGSIIRLFDQSEFSHIGMIFKAPFINQPMVFEASTNKAGLVDIETGRVAQGVELLPLEAKIFSGWYGRVAIRHLTGLSEEEREEMNQKMMGFFEEVSGRPYEKNKLDLILSSMKFIEEALPFLKNRKEDLSSLFCSELVAAALQRMGILEASRVSHSYTPDDFSSNRELVLLKGSLSKEIYIDLRDINTYGNLTVQSL